jgi:hypothetical protein
VFGIWAEMGIVEKNNERKRKVAVTGFILMCNTTKIMKIGNEGQIE